MVNNSKVVEKDLRKRFNTFLRSQGNPITPLWDALNMIRERKWTAYSFGGVPRGVLDAGSKYNPRDLDLVFADEDFLEFEAEFKPLIQKKNNYGGLKLKFNGLAIDAWPLCSTWAFRKNLIKDVSFASLPKTTFLNIDGIIVEANPLNGRKRSVFESGFYDGWAQKVLDINLVDNPHPEICFARTLQIARRFGFKVSPNLAIYLWEFFVKTPILKLEDAQKKHYGKVHIGITELLDVCRNLDRGLSESLFTPIRIFPSRSTQMELVF